MWWSNNEQRRQQKEIIKNIIKRTKLAEKTAHSHSHGVPMSANTPPSLCHSLPTSDTFSDNVCRTRAVSVESQLSLDYNFNQMSPPEMYPVSMAPPMFAPGYPHYQPFAPYEVDIKTERQMYVNDIPTRRDSSISTFSTYQAPPMPGSSFPVENWIQQDYFEQRTEQFTEEPIDFNFFEFSHNAFSPSHQAVIPVDDCDRHLLDHFIEHVLRQIFPILDANQHGSARTDVILPALETNKPYLHCCLSVSAMHLKATERVTGQQIDDDIIRHRFAAIRTLCEALNRDTDHDQILEATLGMIFFQCTVGRPDDRLADIPWHQHFQAVVDLVHHLNLEQHLVDLNNNPQAQPPFNMTLAAWIDILGSTMRGQKPSFADTYRSKLAVNAPSGLAELMGCEDKIMYLISEIACLEALKLDNMDEVTLCAHIKFLGEQISMTEPGTGYLQNVYSPTGAIRPKQLSKNMTAIFRIAARIYLCSLVPGFNRSQPNITNLVDSLTEAMAYIPGGADGFDRSLVWPLLIAGSVSLPDSSFRTMFAERTQRLGETSDYGSFGRMRELLKDVWKMNDDALVRGETASIHWRDAMKQKGWDFLLI
jgi:C6 transcription factor Pro1